MVESVLTFKFNTPFPFIFPPVLLYYYPTDRLHVSLQWLWIVMGSSTDPWRTPWSPRLPSLSRLIRESCCLLNLLFSISPWGCTGQPRPSVIGSISILGFNSQSISQEFRPQPLQCSAAPCSFAFAPVGWDWGEATDEQFDVSVL